MRRHVIRAIAIVGTVVLTLGLGAVAATADPFGTWTGDTGPFADGVGHTYCWGSGFNDALKDNADAAMANLDAQTEMFDSFQASCDVVNTDIFWFDADLAGERRGESFCVTWITYGEICNSADVRLDPVKLNEGDDDNLDTTKTACHEVGHTVGLTHSSSGDDCMRSGEMPSTNVQWRRYNQHHVGHINGRY